MLVMQTCVSAVDVRTDEASDGATASSDNGEFTLVSDVVDENPS